MVFSIRDYGAVGDGIALDSPAIQRAVDACHQNGGGKVCCSAGKYRVGSIELKSHVELHLESGCTLISSRNHEDFKVRNEAENPDERYAVLTAFDADNITLSGTGTIDGMCRECSFDDPDNGGNGEEHLSIDYWGVFRPRLVRFENVRDLTVRDLTFRDSARWTLHLAGCRRVLISAIRILNHMRAANTDGIDPDCCRDVLIRDCFIQTGDDGIVVKSTRTMAERYGACENIQVTNCIIHSSSGALKIGTESFGDIRNVTFSHCLISGSSHSLSVYARDGGNVENILFCDIQGEAWAHGNAPKHRNGFVWWGAGDAVFVSNAARRNDSVAIGTIRNVVFRNLDIACESSTYISGTAERRVENITMVDCTLRFRRKGTQPTGFFDERPSNRNRYAHCNPGIFAEYTNALRVKNLRITWENPHPEAWSEFAQAEHCSNLAFADCEGSPAQFTFPMFRFSQCAELMLEHIRRLSGDTLYLADCPVDVKE